MPMSSNHSVIAECSISIKDTAQAVRKRCRMAIEANRVRRPPGRRSQQQKKMPQLASCGISFIESSRIARVVPSPQPTNAAEHLVRHCPGRTVIDYLRVVQLEHQAGARKYGDADVMEGPIAASRRFVRIDP